LTWLFQKPPLHYKRRLISKVFGAQATTTYALMGPWPLANYMFKLVWFNFNITKICYISFIVDWSRFDCEQYRINISMYKQDHLIVSHKHINMFFLSTILECMVSIYWCPCHYLLVPTKKRIMRMVACVNMWNDRCAMARLVIVTFNNHLHQAWGICTRVQTSWNVYAYHVYNILIFYYLIVVN
jgi:hypothetical protein